MFLASKWHWSTFERLSPTLFLVGGAGVVTHAGMMGVEAFTSLATPPDVFITIGHLIALSGLFGLYPGLVGRIPRIARLSLGVAIVPVLGWLVMTVGQFAVLAGRWSSLNEALPGVFFLILLGSSILTYGLFGAATLLGGLGSRTVGLLVLTPGVLMAVLLVDSALTGLTALDGFLIGSALAATMLALGFRLRTWLERVQQHSPSAAVGA